MRQLWSGLAWSFCMKRVRIVSDGTSAGTRVVDVATGQPIACVVALSVEVEAGGVPMARVTQLYRVDDLDMEADLAERAVVPPPQDPVDPASGD